MMTGISMKVLFSEMDTMSSLVRVDSSCFEEKDGLPEEAFAKVQEIFSSVDWLVPKGDSGVEILKESLAALEVQALAKSPASVISENQSDLSPKFSPNADMARAQADHNFSPSEMRAVISSKLTLIPSGDHSPPSSTSPRHQFSITKTLHLSPRQQHETKAQPSCTIEAIDSPLHEPKETSYSKTSPASAPSQSARDAGAFFGPSLFHPQALPFTPTEDKIGSVSAVPSLPLLPLEATGGRPLRDDNKFKPGISSPHTERPKSHHDRIIEDGRPKSESFLSSTLSAEDLTEAPKVGTRPTPPPPPPMSDLHAAPTEGNSASICGPAQPAPLPSPSSHSKEDSAPRPPIFTPYSTEKKAKEPASFPPSPTLPQESSSITEELFYSSPPPPPPPPPLLPPSILPLRKDYAPKVVLPPPLSHPVKEDLVSRHTPHPPPPPPKESSSGGGHTPHSGVGASLLTPVMGDSSGILSVPCPPPPPQLPKEISGGGGPPPPPHPVGPRNPPNVSPPQPPPAPAIPTTKSSSNIPSAPPPPHSTNNPASSSGGSLPGAPSPPPPLAPPPGTKGKALLSRTMASRNNQMKKLKPLHWLKISKAVSGSLWAETQKSGEASK